MSTQGHANAPGSGQLPPPPPPAPEGGGFQGIPPVPTGTRGKPSKKLIIISSIVLVVLAAAIAGFFIIQNILRGGAGTPEEAAEKVVTSINDKDLVALYGMISPRERDAVTRVQEQTQKLFKDHGVAESLTKTTSDSTVDSELSLDGVEISVNQSTPVVTKISDDYALIRYSSGEVTMTVRPEETKGLLRAGFESNGDMSEVSESQFIADMGPNQTGITLVASKSDGRWYVSPLLSILDATSAQSRYDSTNDSAGYRGYLPDDFARGGDKPEIAAANAVRAMVDAINQNDPQVLAPALVKDEAAALYLYGGLWNSSGASDDVSRVKLGSASFTAGPVMGDRAHAIVENVSLGSEDGRVVFTEKCIEDAQNTQTCLNGSGYVNFDGNAADNAMSMASLDGKFGLTAVKEDGSWKVSLLDTAVDMASSWLKSLTPEQTLSFLGMERTTVPGGELEIGTNAEVEFNSAGYAVRTINVQDQQRVVLSSEQDVDGTIYIEGEGGKLRQEEFTCDLSGYSDACELMPGKYIMSIDASDTSAWHEGFKSGGNDFKMSTGVLLERYIEPPRIDGFVEGRDLSFQGVNDYVTVDVPEKTNKKLFLEFDEGMPGPDALGFVVGDKDWNPDQSKTLTIDGRNATRTEIALPIETGVFTLTITPKSGSMGDWYDVSPRLYFADE